MPAIEPLPAVAGRVFYCLDRLSPPDELPLASLADVPPAELWRRLRDEARVNCESP